jgi:hypothetical protein
MASHVEVEDYFIRKLQGMVITPNDTVPILSKHLKGYVPDGRLLGIANNKFLGGIDQFTEVKVVHNGTIHYIRPGVRDEQQGSTQVNKFQGQVRKSYLANLKRKDLAHFGTSEGVGGPLETIFRQIVFKPLVFGIFGKMSSNVVGLVETAVEYGVEHLGRNMAATTVDTVRTDLRMRYKTQLSMASWRGYANLLLDKTKYVGTCQLVANKAQIRQDMRGRGDLGVYAIHGT